MNELFVDKLTVTSNSSMAAFHSHTHYEIYILVEGNRNIFVNNNLYSLHQQQAIVIPPYSLHKTDGGAYTRYNINVMTSSLDEKEAEILKKLECKVLMLQEPYYSAILLLSEKINSFGEQENSDNDKVISSLFTSALLFLGDCDNQLNRKEYTPEKQLPASLISIITYLNTNYKEEIRLEDLANIFFISKNCILYNFKRYMNCTPVTYLTKLRITHAKKLLRETYMTINEISISCGFSSPNYFGDVFKHYENMNPSEYRKFKTLI